jgi:hypothetical protein
VEGFIDSGGVPHAHDSILDLGPVLPSTKSSRLGYRGYELRQRELPLAPGWCPLKSLLEGGGISPPASS